MDRQSVGLKYNGEGIAYCAEKYGGEMITLNSLEEFNKLTEYLEPGIFLAAASDREEEGVLKWQDSKNFIAAKSVLSSVAEGFPSCCLKSIIVLGFKGGLQSSNSN